MQTPTPLHRDDALFLRAVMPRPRRITGRADKEGATSEDQTRPQDLWSPAGRTPALRSVACRCDTVGCGPYSRGMQQHRTAPPATLEAVLSGSPTSTSRWATRSPGWPISWSTSLPTGCRAGSGSTRPARCRCCARCTGGRRRQQARLGQAVHTQGAGRRDTALTERLRPTDGCHHSSQPASRNRFRSSLSSGAGPNQSGRTGRVRPRRRNTFTVPQSSNKAHKSWPASCRGLRRRQGPDQRKCWSFSPPRLVRRPVYRMDTS